MTTKAQMLTELLRLCTYEVIFLKFKWAPAPTDLQLRAVFAFRLGVFSFPYAHCKRVIPDTLPRLSEDVAQAFEIALTRIYVTVWSDTHVCHSRCARFDA